MRNLTVLFSVSIAMLGCSSPQQTESSGLVLPGAERVVHLENGVRTGYAFGYSYKYRALEVFDYYDSSLLKRGYSRLERFYPDNDFIPRDEKDVSILWLAREWISKDSTNVIFVEAKEWPSTGKVEMLAQTYPYMEAPVNSSSP